MDKCSMCHERDRVGYKYCKECKKDLNAMYQRRRRLKSMTKCEYSGCDKLTNSKYCKRCSQLAKSDRINERNMAKRVRGKSPVSKPVNPDLLHRGRIHYEGYVSL